VVVAVLGYSSGSLTAAPALLTATGYCLRGHGLCRVRPDWAAGNTLTLSLPLLLFWNKIREEKLAAAVTVSYVGSFLCLQTESTCK